MTIELSDSDLLQTRAYIDGQWVDADSDARPSLTNNHAPGSNLLSRICFPLTALLAVLMLPTLSFAQLPHTFANGEVADAGEINENFETLRQLFSESLRPLIQPESTSTAGRTGERVDRFEVDCSTDNQALKNAIASGHSAITVIAGTCDANTDDIDLDGLRLGINGVISGDTKPILDTNGGRFNSSASLIGLSNLVIKGSVRSAVGFLGLNNVDIDCSAITNPAEHGVWTFGSQVYFIGSSLSGCGGFLGGFNAILYAESSQVTTAAGSQNALNLFQGATAWSTGTSWEATQGNLMTIGKASDVYLAPPMTIKGDIAIRFGGLLTVAGPAMECPETADPDGSVSLGFTALMNWPNRCQTLYPVACSDGLQLTGYSEGQTCR